MSFLEISQLEKELLDSRNKIKLFTALSKYMVSYIYEYPKTKDEFENNNNLFFKKLYEVKYSSSFSFVKFTFLTYNYPFSEYNSNCLISIPDQKILIPFDSISNISKFMGKLDRINLDTLKEK